MPWRKLVTAILCNRASFSARNDFNGIFPFIKTLRKLDIEKIDVYLTYIKFTNLYFNIIFIEWLIYAFSNSIN